MTPPSKTVSVSCSYLYACFSPPSRMLGSPGLPRGQRSAHFFQKGPEREYCRLCRLTLSVKTTQFCSCKLPVVPRVPIKLCSGEFVSDDHGTEHVLGNVPPRMTRPGCQQCRRETLPLPHTRWVVTSGSFHGAQTLGGPPLSLTLAAAFQVTTRPSYGHTRDW